MRAHSGVPHLQQRFTRIHRLDRVLTVVPALDSVSRRCDVALARGKACVEGGALQLVRCELCLKSLATSMEASSLLLNDPKGLRTRTDLVPGGMWAKTECSRSIGGPHARKRSRTNC